eukprot:3557717-Amphidinium_carterae.2
MRDGGVTLISGPASVKPCKRQTAAFEYASRIAPGSAFKGTTVGVLPRSLTTWGCWGMVSWFVWKTWVLFTQGWPRLCR